MNRLTLESKPAPTVAEITRTCYANLHMKPVEYAVWSVCRSISYQSGILYFDGEDIAKLFEDTGKDRIYRAAKRLVKKGWFVVIQKRRRAPKTGIWMATRYRVLSTEEWTKTHPHTCSIPQNANGVQSSKRDRLIHSSKREWHHSSKRKQPFPVSQTAIPQNAKYIDKEYLEKEIEREEPPSLSSKDKTRPNQLTKQEVKDLADEIVAMALGENPKASFSQKAKTAIQEVIRNDRPTYDELVKIVPGIVRLMDDFQLRNAGSTIAASLPGQLLALRKKVEVEEDERIDMAAADRYIDEQLAKKKAIEEAEAEKRREEEAYALAHMDEI